MKTTKEFYNVLKSSDVHLCGSRAWGGYKEDSDYDFLIREDKFNSILSLLETKPECVKIHNEIGYGDFHILRNIVSYEIILIDGTNINLLVYTEENFPKVLEANRVMKGLAKLETYKELLGKKYNRCRLFENLVDVALMPYIICNEEG